MTDSPLTEADWKQSLERELGVPVDVRYGRARHRVIEAKPKRGGGYDLRMSAMFRDAPADIRWAVGRWMSVGKRARKACTRLDEWIEEAAKQMPVARRTKLRPKGETYDLVEISEELRASEFADDFGTEREWPAITWGARSARRAKRSLRLGSYDVAQNLVRVHPVLDQPAVPRWFVRYILFHEILHAAMPPRRGRGNRLLHHPPEYRARERTLDDYDRARRWQEKHLNSLIKSAQTRKPIRVRKKNLFQQLGLFP